ncbi:MAG: hypothetical protein ILO10_06930, partial [Kiritimatiellae bacterium]|nr:hypothetical protein [Kiritimatiellia bacterium]
GPAPHPRNTRQKPRAFSLASPFRATGRALAAIPRQAWRTVAILCLGAGLVWAGLAIAQKVRHDRAPLLAPITSSCHPVQAPFLD